MPRRCVYTQGAQILYELRVPQDRTHHNSYLQVAPRNQRLTKAPRPRCGNIAHSAHTHRRNEGLYGTRSVYREAAAGNRLDSRQFRQLAVDLNELRRTSRRPAEVPLGVRAFPFQADGRSDRRHTSRSKDVPPRFEPSQYAAFLQRKCRTNYCVPDRPASGINREGQRGKGFDGRRKRQYGSGCFSERKGWESLAGIEIAPRQRRSGCCGTNDGRCRVARAADILAQKLAAEEAKAGTVTRDLPHVGQRMASNGAAQ